MTDPRELARTYLRRQASLSPTRVVLPPGTSVRLGEPAAESDTQRPRDSTRESGGETGAPANANDDRAPAGPASGRPSGPPDNREPAAAPVAPGLTIEAPPVELFSASPLQQLASLDAVSAEVRECTSCPLCEGRTNTVPGEGRADARLVVVGEGPGRVEDETGRPFVGRAGELLTKILAAIDLPRKEVYICNVVKCRPPENRSPTDDEMRACLPYLYRQLELIRPKLILAMGGTAANALLETRAALGQLRGKVHRFRGTALVVTYHPAALLRNPNWKRPTWDDIRLARQLLDA